MGLIGVSLVDLPLLLLAVLFVALIIFLWVSDGPIYRIDTSVTRPNNSGEQTDDEE